MVVWRIESKVFESAASLCDELDQGELRFVQKRRQDAGATKPFEIGRVCPLCFSKSVQLADSVVLTGMSIYGVRKALYLNRLQRYLVRRYSTLK